MAQEDGEKPKQPSVVPNQPSWRLAPFVGLLADPFISGVPELERGSPAASLRALSFSLRTLEKSSPTSSPIEVSGNDGGSSESERAEGKRRTRVVSRNDLNMWSNEDIALLPKLRQIMDRVADVYAVPASLKDGDMFNKFIESWCDEISKMKVGAVMMAPGGWSGSSSVGVLVHVIERMGSDEFALVTCNGGNSGLEYHPSETSGLKNDRDVVVGPLKLRYKTCLRLGDIPLARMTDPSWWALQMSQWMKMGQQAGEYQRAEVLYDVLLPYIGGQGKNVGGGDDDEETNGASKTPGASSGGGSGLAAILASVQRDDEEKTKKKTSKGGVVLSLRDALSDSHADYRTPCRSGTDWWRSAWEATRYVLRRWGISPPKLKQLSMLMRCGMMDLVFRDVDAIEKASSRSTREQPLEPIFSAFNRTPKVILLGEDALELASDASRRSAVTSLLSASSSLEYVALFFGRSSCEKCTRASADLKTWHTSGKREVVLVDVGEPSAGWRANMPWFALSAESSASGKELIYALGIRALPAVVILSADLESVVSWDGLTHLAASDCESEGSKRREENTNSGDTCCPCHPAKFRAFTETDLRVIRFAKEQVSRAVVKANAAKRLSDDDLEREEARLAHLRSEDLRRKVPSSSSCGEASKDDDEAEEGEEDVDLPPPVLPPEGNMLVRGYERTKLLDNSKTIDRWAGRTDARTSPASVDLLLDRSRIDSAARASQEMQRCISSVRALLQRASDASASSRLAVQYQIIHAIGHLFTAIVPLPKATSAVIHGDTVSAESMLVDKGEVDEKASDSTTTTTTTTTTAPTTETAAVESAVDSASDDSRVSTTTDPAIERRRGLAQQLMQFLPQYSIDMCMGVLEISGDSVSVAGNWLITHGASVESDLATALERHREATRPSSIAEETTKTDNAPRQEPSSSSALPFDATGVTVKGAAAFRQRMAALDDDDDDCRRCIWAERLPVELQLTILRQVHYLSLTFSAMWQAIDYPTRAFDAERAVVALSMLAIFDVVVRTPAKDKALFVSELLGSDGGYALSSTVCQSNRLIEDVSATMELHDPQLQRARGEALEYVTAMRRSCTKTLFRLRMPLKIEIKKHSSTCRFLKRLLARCGFPLLPRTRGLRASPPEIEALCTWLFDDSTPLAQKHPAFRMMRDVVAVFKFLSTMVTREQELMARRNQRDRAMWTEFSFSYEEAGRSRAWRTLENRAQLEWEVMGFRGAPEKDTADVDCLGFGGRHLFFGEGPVVQSPADPCRLLGLPHAASEDDILHAETLPSFDDTLSREEAELLFSFLTVPYARIPLILNFFASKDRVTYLFNVDLQKMLEAVIFEAGAFVPRFERAAVKRVPERRTHAQTLREERARLDDARLGPNKEYLGTTSSPWPTNMAKGVGEGIPVLHANGDDIEAVMWCMETAVEWRQKFGKDIIVDIVCYRKHGHDDLEKPSISNPYQYMHIDSHPSLRDIYVAEMLGSKALSQIEIDDIERGITDEYSGRYENFQDTERAINTSARASDSENNVDAARAKSIEWAETFGKTRHRPNPTACPIETLTLVGEAVTRLPDDGCFKTHDDVKAIMQRRAKSIETGKGVDMATAEALAFGTILLKYEPGDDADYWKHHVVVDDESEESMSEKIRRFGSNLMMRAEASQRGPHADVHVRLSGQDSERGTFNQRHAVIVSQNVDDWITAHRGESSRLKVGRRTAIYTPLNHLVDGRNAQQSEFSACNSSLSESAILAFEYGYSIENDNALVVWEAQFGDFCNVAQSIVDEFIVSGEQKWGVATSLTLMLPHGLEGFGPDHSSSRPERFLQALNDDEDEMYGAMSEEQVTDIGDIFDSSHADVCGRVRMHNLVNALASSTSKFDESPSLAQSLTERFVAEQLRKGHILDASCIGELASDASSSSRDVSIGLNNIFVNRNQWIEFFKAWRRRIAEAEHNIRVVNCTTPANVFHVLREQIHRTYLKPLILMTPKWLHTHRHCRSDLHDMSHGTRFERMILDGDAGDNLASRDAGLLADDAEVERLCFVSGKLFYHLAASRRSRRAGHVRFARLEQLAPFPYDDFVRAAAKYPNAEILWVQEEPKNMGAWSYVRPRAETALRETGDVSSEGEGRRVRYVGRPASAAPSSGSASMHHKELRKIIRDALGER
eukprot:g3461.t1